MRYLSLLYDWVYVYDIFYMNTIFLHEYGEPMPCYLKPTHVHVGAGS